MTKFLDQKSGTGPSLPSASYLDFQPTARERVFRDWLLRDVLGSPAYVDHRSWIAKMMLIDGFELPISNVLGFAGFTFQPAATIITNQSTASTTYVDLATVGPTLSGLADGSYAVFFSAIVASSGTDSAVMAPSFNAAAVDGNDAGLATASANANGLFQLVLKSFDTGGNNEIKMKYRGAGGTTVSFQLRKLIAVKFANA